MIKRSLLIIALAVVCTAGMLQLDPCQPDCNGKHLFDKVPDPLNCTNYYICIDDGIPSDHALPCPSGNWFDPTKPGCAPEPGEGCKAACQPPDCHITCNGSFSLISDPFDCGTYYICIAGQVPETVHCNTNNPFFNGVNCVNDKDVCCTVSCVPYCQPGIVQTPDPSDCTKYYICPQEGGPVDPSLHFACGGGKHFDYQSGRCVSGSSCTNLCTEGTTTTNSAVTTTNSAGTTTSTTTTTTKTPSTGCVDSLTCVSSGNFPKCSYCQQEYFQCTAAGTQGVPGKCSGNDVFNINPDYPYCILPTNCPYNPSL